MSNFQPWIRKGLSIYFCITKLVALISYYGSFEFSSDSSPSEFWTSFSIVPSEIPYMIFFILSISSKTWTPLPLLHDVGFKNQRFFQSFIQSSKNGMHEGTHFLPFAWINHMNFDLIKELLKAVEDWSWFDSSSINFHKWS